MARQQRRMETWLRVHCLQQSLTPAPLREAAGYDRLVADPEALRDLVLAFREGLRVCAAVGARPTGVWPAPMFMLPTAVVTRMMRGMFSDPEVRRMVMAHMEHGLSEWVQGFRDVHASARAARLRTPALDHQADVLEAYGW